jgi:iron complex outermembrane receptor protein
MALTIIPFLFQNLYASQPNQGSIAGAQFSKSNRKQLPNYFLQADFSLSEKLHLETGLAFNTTRYSLRDLLQQRKQFRLVIPLGKYGHREQDSPIDLLKTRRFMRPLVRVFDTNSFETLTPWGRLIPV